MRHLSKHTVVRISSSHPPLARRNRWVGAAVGPSMAGKMVQANGDDPEMVRPRRERFARDAFADAQAHDAAQHPVVLFDGECNLCNGWVQFVLARETDDRLRFAPLQSEFGVGLMLRHGLDPAMRDTLVFVSGDRAEVRSRAVIGILRHLQVPWRLFGGVLACLPVFLGDLAYRVMARARYRLFGRTEVCWVPTPATKERFLGT